MKKKSNKLRKLENSRFSLFDDPNKCHYCKSNYNLTWHEIYSGRNRQNSMKYGLCLRLCINCHRLLQDNNGFNNQWHIEGQLKFNEVYPDLDFLSIFRINYL